MRKKKELERAKKKSAKNAKATSAKEKSANSRFFLTPALEAWFQNTKTLGRGKRKGLEYSTVFTIYIIGDRGEETERKDGGEETDG